MEKVSSSSCYDAIVIKQETETYKSTPFQVVFSNNVLKNKIKKSLPQQEDIQMYVNQIKVDIPIKIDSNSGRVVFQKRYTRKMSLYSDSSDMSEDQAKSQKGISMSSQRKLISPNKTEKIQDIKNEHAPFWHFAWLFNKKKQQSIAPLKKFDALTQNETNLTKINQQVYQGQQNARQPFFHISLCGNELKKKDTKEQILKSFYKNRIQYSSFIKDPPFYLNDANLVVKIDQSIYTWQLGLAILTCRFAFGKQLSNQLIDDLIKNKFTRSKWLKYLSNPGITKLQLNQLQQAPIKTIDLRASRSKSTDKNDKFDAQSQGHIIKYAKTPSSDLIQKMNLKYGLNRAKFIVKLSNNTTQQVNMKIFLWNHHQKVIISDIDGTITKSDILGQILSDWIHKGVIKLYNQIYKRDYKIIYLTARAIGQYQQTTKFLQTVQQDGIHLPQGPLFMSPDGYIRSFTRQVIYKTPDYLKTKILANLNQVFPNSSNPIFCGFGNRDTDSIAYLKINIHPERIFCISEKSLISRQSAKDQTTITYLQMFDKIDNFFPLITKVVDKILNQGLQIKKSQQSGVQQQIGQQKNKQNFDKNESQKQNKQNYKINNKKTDKKVMKIEHQYDEDADIGDGDSQNSNQINQNSKRRKIRFSDDQKEEYQDYSPMQKKQRSSSFSQLPQIQQSKNQQRKTQQQDINQTNIPSFDEISQKFNFNFDDTQNKK